MTSNFIKSENSMKIAGIFPILLACYEMVTYLSNDMYLPALPQMAHDLSVSNELTQLSLTTWFLGAASMQLFLGPMSDRFGRRPILLLGGLIFTLATIVCATTSDITVLLIARLLQGCAVCSVTVAGYAAVHEIYDQKEAIRIFAIMSSITLLGPAFGPMAGGLVLYFAHWRDIFWLLAGLAIILIAFLYRRMPESLAIEQRHPIHFSKIYQNYKEIITNKNFMLNILSLCSFFTVLISWITTAPFIVIDMFHYSPFLFGVFQVFVFGSFIIGGRFVKLGIDYIGVKNLIRVSLFICVAASILSILSASIFADQFIYFVIALMIFAFGAGLSFSPLQRLAIESSTTPMGSRTAILSSMMSLSGTLGSLLASYFYSGTTFSLALIVLIATLFSVFVQILIPITNKSS